MLSLVAAAVIIALVSSTPESRRAADIKLAKYNRWFAGFVIITWAVLLAPW